MESEFVKHLKEKLLELRHENYFRTFERRPLSASEVLFMESLHVCIQEGWERLASHLILGRILDQRFALRKLRRTEGPSNHSNSIFEKVNNSLAWLVKMSADIRRQYPRKSTVGGNKPIPIAEVEGTAVQVLEHLRATVLDLPLDVADGIDQDLCTRHRRRVLIGLDKTRSPLLSAGTHEHATYGLAISGGGIRSASFAMGVFQSLAKTKLLPVFDYVSSVSGGGYAASWLLSWAYRHASGLEGVSDELAGAAGRESSPLRWVRRHSSYLAPRLNLSMTSDTPALIVAYLFNWLPIFLLICLALSTSLIFPHAIVATAKSLASIDGKSRLLVSLLTSSVFILFLGFVIRLTSFRRRPVSHARYPVGLPILVVIASAFTAVVMSATAPVFLSVIGDMGLLELRWPLFGSPLGRLGALFLIWLVLYGLAILVAKLLTNEEIQIGIDRLREYFTKEAMPFRGPLERISIPAYRSGLGVVFGSALGALLTSYLLFLAESQDSIK